MLFRSIQEDGSARQKVLPQAVIILVSVSPDGEWVVVDEAQPGEEQTSALLAYPTRGGSPVRLTGRPGWFAGGTSFYLGFGGGMERQGRTYVMPTRAGNSLPVPASGVSSEKDVAALPGVKVIEQWPLYPGLDASIYAFAKEGVQRNLYRVPLQ